MEKLRRTIDEKNDEIQRISVELTTQREQINQLNNENSEVNLQIEQLDQQHSDAIDGLLCVKKNLQAKCENLEADLAEVRANQILAAVKFERLALDHDNLLQSNEELVTKYDQVEQSYVKSVQDHVNLAGEKNLLRAELEKRMLEISDLTLALEEKEREAIEKFEIVEMEKEKLVHEQQAAQADSDHCDDSGKMSASDEIKDRCDSSASMVSVEEQLMQLRSESDTLVEELKIAREATRKAEDLKVSYEALNAEKENLQSEFEGLRNENSSLKTQLDLLRSDYEALNADFEATKSVNDEEIAAMQTQCRDIQAKLEQIRIENESLNKQNESRTAVEEELEKVREAYTTLKTEAGDLESRLLQENMMSQKQVIDLQSVLNSRNTEGSTSDDTISMAELRSILVKQMNYAPAVTNIHIKPFIKEFLRSVKSTYQQLQDIESNREDLMKQFEVLSGEKAKLQKETETLKADLHHFETEVAELMKNNEILLVELENVKAGKLEPISEQNEDSIVDLEKQLEDVSVLNQSLEDEYKNLRRKMDEKEEEKYELIEKLEELEAQFDEQTEKMDELKKHIEDLETEKSNILFELNEFKTDDSKVAEQTEADLNKLHKQLETLETENFDLSGQLVNHKDELGDKLQALNEAHEQIQYLKETLSKCSCKDGPSIDPALAETLRHELQATRESLEVKSQALANIQSELAQEREKHRSLEEQIAGLNQTIVDLQQTTTPADENAKLNETIAILTHEKQELISAVQQKHNESVEYHTQIQQLNQLISGQMQSLAAAQQQQNVPCPNCPVLTEQLKTAVADASKVNDQIVFLREKSDILLANLMTEQNNQKVLAQEKIDLIEEKQTLTRDLNRLREHLMEMENAHTAEMVELQSIVDQTKQQMTSMLDEAKKSSTAYTSAR